MLTVEDANSLTGHWVKAWHPKRREHGTVQLVRVLNETTAYIQPKGHKKLEIANLCDLMRHEKAEHIQAEMRASHERRNGNGPAPQLDVPHLIANVRAHQFWSDEAKGFTPALAKAKLYESKGSASIARGRILFGKRFRDELSAIDVDVVTAEEARALVIAWNKIEAIDPAAVGTVEAADVANSPAAESQPAPVAVVAEPAAPAMESRHGDTWVDGPELAEIARPRHGCDKSSPKTWALTGCMPHAAVRRERFRDGVFKYVFNRSLLERCGWMAEQHEIDAQVADGKLAPNRVRLKHYHDPIPHDQVSRAFVPAGEHVAALGRKLKNYGAAAEARMAPPTPPAPVAPEPEPEPIEEPIVNRLAPRIEIPEPETQPAPVVNRAPAPAAACQACAPTSRSTSPFERWVTAAREESEAEAMFLEARAAALRAHADLVMATRLAKGEP